MEEFINFEPSKECFSWCQEQHFIHATNMELYGIIILLIAFLCLVLFYIITRFQDNIINSTEWSKEQLERAVFLLADFATILMIAFFAWFFFFR